MDRLTFKELRKAQKQLDTHIIDNFSLSLSRKEYFTNQVTAFMVELGELANEVRSFKHWSKKPPSSKEVILEEYVDGLHFILSITNFLGGDFTPEILSLEPSMDEINNVFLNTWSLASELYLIAVTESEESASELLVELVEIYLHLGVNNLGFELDEIITAYHKKQQVNYERQRNDY